MSPEALACWSSYKVPVKNFADGPDRFMPREVAEPMTMLVCLHNKDHSEFSVVPGENDTIPIIAVTSFAKYGDGNNLLDEGSTAYIKNRLIRSLLQSGSVMRSG